MFGFDVHIPKMQEFHFMFMYRLLTNEKQDE